MSSPVKDSGGPSTVPPSVKAPPVSHPSSIAASPLPDLLLFIPAYSRWFSWNNIHECELRFLPEFFDSRSPSKNPRVYMYYRNSIIKQFRHNPSSKLTFTDARKTLVGDVVSIRRVFDFLDAWGLINYSPSSLTTKSLKWEDHKDSSKSSPLPTSSDPVPPTAKRLCNGCKSVCSIACFVCDKYDLTLCARCYVRGNYRVGVNSSDFRRVEISEEPRTDWTDKETLQLLEAVMHYGDDWKKIAQHIGGRSEKDCITHFIKLPFGEEFTGYSNSGDVNNKPNQLKDSSDADCELENIGSSSPSKRMRLTPLADASNPIMAQVAFLSALVGLETAEAAARAAVTTLTEVEYGANKGSLGSFARNQRQQDVSVASNGDTNLNMSERACLDANALLKKEELDVERAISGIAGVQMKEILDKIVRFEELDMQVEKEWQQLEQMKDLLFVDQLTLLFHKSSPPKIGERMEETVKSD